MSLPVFSQVGDQSVRVNPTGPDDGFSTGKPRVIIDGRRPSDNVDVVLGEEAIAERLHLKFTSRCVFELRQSLREFGDDTKFKLDQMIVGVATPDHVRNPAIAPAMMRKFVNCLGETHQQFIREENRRGPQQRLLTDAIRRLRDFHKRQLELAETPKANPNDSLKGGSPLPIIPTAPVPAEPDSPIGTQ